MQPLRNILRVNKITCDCIFRQTSTKPKFPRSDEYIKNLPVFDYVNTRKNRNRVYVWGSIKTGALGVRFVKRKNLISTIQHPKRLGFAEKHDVISASCGFGFTAFTVDTEDGVKVYGTGLNTDSQIGCHRVGAGKPMEFIFFPQQISLPFRDPKTVKIKKISAGRAHLAILSNEGLYLMGNNSYGQCGRKIVEDELYFDNYMINHVKDIDRKEISDVICGQDHTIAITTDGALYSCGWGADGQTGIGHYNSVSHFTKIQGDLKDEKIVKVSCRSDFVMALNDKGQAFGWGNTEYAQITTKNDLQQVSSPMFLESCKELGKIKDIASGGSFCMVLNDQGHVFVWGFGLLGAGPSIQQSSVPLRIPPQLFGLNDFSPNTRVTSIECGLSHLAAITSEGDLYTWGRNRDCCLGLGDTKDQYFPLKVAIGGRTKTVSCGFDHTLAICKSFTD